MYTWSSQILHGKSQSFTVDRKKEGKEKKRKKKCPSTSNDPSPQVLPGKSKPPTPKPIGRGKTKTNRTAIIRQMESEEKEEKTLPHMHIPVDKIFSLQHNTATPTHPPRASQSTDHFQTQNPKEKNRGTYQRGQQARPKRRPRYSGA